jgi:transcriptional regulator with PAS, ATPase and Fis domain
MAQAVPEGGVTGVKPKVVVVTNKDFNRDRHRARLERILGEFIDIDAYSLESGLDRQINCDVLIVPNQIIALKSMSYLLPRTEVMVMKRTILRRTWSLISGLPAGTRVLLVDSNHEFAVQYAAMLYELGAGHLRINPYNPDDAILPDVDIVLHPNEPDKVPSAYQHVVNLENSEVDVSTLVDVLSKLNLLNNRSREALFLHLSDTMPSSPGMLSLLNTMTMSGEYLNILMDSDERIVVAFNVTGKISMFNARAREALHLSHDMYLGPTGVDSPPHELSASFLLDKDIHSTCIEVNNRPYVLSKHLLEKNGTVTGGLVIMTETGGNCPERNGHRFPGRNKGHRIKYGFSDIIGQSAALLDVIAFARKVAVTESDVLIEGESGTGKELLAHAIHNASLRKDGPFVAFNCASLSSSLLESELFGYEEGSFTGARKGGKQGMFELAHGGSIFLDEIGEISREIQTKLLRVLQEREVMRVGGTDLIPINIRVISSTNQDLYRLVRAGSFREDLYFRLNVVSLRLPPLRERIEDIPYLIKHILAEKGIKQDIPNEFMELCGTYYWRGNVRELRNCMEYMINRGGEYQGQALPEYMKKAIAEAGHALACSEPCEHLATMGDPLVLQAILQRLRDARHRHQRIGRGSLVSQLNSAGLHVTEQELRHLLSRLREAGLVAVGVGRAGTIITRKGELQLESTGCSG